MCCVRRFCRQRIRSIDQHFSWCIKTRKKKEELLPHTSATVNWFCGIGRFIQSRPISLRCSTLLHVVLRCAVDTQIHAASLRIPRYPAGQSTLFCSSNYAV